MGGTILMVGHLRAQRNFVPLPYRRVSYQPYAGAMTEAAIREHLLAREVYRRTDVVVLHDDAGALAVAAVQRAEPAGFASDNPSGNNLDTATGGATDRDATLGQPQALFSRVAAVEVLALPESCVFLHDPATDPANPSALARLARNHGIGPDRTVIVQGAFDHINLIHQPDPLIIRVVEVAPPEPPKLYAMAEQVLGYADLPPIGLELERIELRELAAGLRPEAFLVPCRSGGLDELGAPVYCLDERPPERYAWTLIGCERSLQFHRHYYGDEPTRVEMCPRQLTPPSGRPTLLKCCLLEFDIEQDGERVIVPWGADLKMVERALRLLAEVNDHG